jgi:L-lactate dehydrogenase complex protein LldG
MRTPSDTLSRAALWRRFAEKAEGLGACVRFVADDEATGTMLTESVAGLVCTRGVVERFPRVAERCTAKAAARQEGDNVVASGAFAVAETGSVLLYETPEDRGSCFLADRLWLLVCADRIVPTLEAGFEQVAALVRGGAHYLTLMSGPSRTADIERVLTIGVHGPREVMVVVVGEAVG